MYAPVDQRAAARNFLGGKGAAQSGNGTPCAEGDVHVVHLAQSTRGNQLTDLVDGGIEAVDNADVEHFAGLMLDCLHFLRLGVGACGRLFAQDVLAGAQSVHSDDGVHPVGCAD